MRFRVGRLNLKMPLHPFLKQKIYDEWYALFDKLNKEIFIQRILYSRNIRYYYLNQDVWIKRWYGQNIVIFKVHANLKSVIRTLRIVQKKPIGIIYDKPQFNKSHLLYEVVATKYSWTPLGVRSNLELTYTLKHFRYRESQNWEWFTPKGRSLYKAAIDAAQNLIANVKDSIMKMFLQDVFEDNSHDPDEYSRLDIYIGFSMRTFKRRIQNTKFDYEKKFDVLFRAFSQYGSYGGYGWW